MKNDDFVELIRNVKTIKYQYKKLVGKKENTTLIKQIKRGIYVINIIEWKKDCVWKYLNDELTYNEMLGYLKVDYYGRPILDKSHKEL